MLGLREGNTVRKSAQADSHSERPLPSSGLRKAGMMCVFVALSRKKLLDI